MTSFPIHAAVSNVYGYPYGLSSWGEWPSNLTYSPSGGGHETVDWTPPEWIGDSLKKVGGAAIIAGGGAALYYCRSRITATRTFFSNLVLMVNEHGTMKSDILAMKAELIGEDGRSLKQTIQKNEASLRAIDARQRASFEIKTDIGFFLDPMGKYVSVTSGFTELTGLDINSVKDGGWKRGLHPDHVQRFAASKRIAIETGEAMLGEEFHFRHVSRPVVTACKFDMKPIRGEDGEIDLWAAKVMPIVSAEEDTGYAGPDMHNMDPEDDGGRPIRTRRGPIPQPPGPPDIEDETREPYQGTNEEE